MTDTDYIGFPVGPVWQTDGDFDPTKFFQALRLFLGNGLYISIEVTSLGKEIEEALDRHSVPAKHLVRPQTIRPKSGVHHFRLDNASLELLVRLSENHASPEYADHVTVYGDHVVLEACDFASDPIYICGSQGEAFIQEFAGLCGVAYRKIRGLNSPE